MKAIEEGLIIVNIQAGNINLFSSGNKIYQAGNTATSDEMKHTVTTADESIKGKKPEAVKASELGIGNTNEIGQEEEKESQKLQQIMAKFRAGEKLSPADLSYLAKHSPDTYKQVTEIMKAREQLEAAMRTAKSQEEVQEVYMQAMSTPTVSTGSASELGGTSGADLDIGMAEIAQLADAAKKYMSSISYDEKSLTDDGALGETREESTGMDTSSVQKKQEKEYCLMDILV